MLTEYEVAQAARLIKIVKFLIARADERGVTHGEKHHYHEVCGALLSKALTIIHEPPSVTERNLDTDAPSDIPF